MLFDVVLEIFGWSIRYVNFVFYIMIGILVCICNFVTENIKSIDCPFFAKFRHFIKEFLSVIFSKRINKRVDYDEETIKRGNDYIDSLLEEMFQNRAEEYDPYVLEDSFVGFNKKVFFVNVSGEAKLHNGYIKGLSTLHRARDCSLSSQGDKLKVKADLGAGELDFHYSGSVKFMNFGPTISVQGTLSYIEVHMEFEVNSKNGREGRLTQFNIDDMRGMKVRVTGLGPVNWAVNPIVSGVTKIFKRFVRNFMENKVEKHISQRIPNFQFPVEGNEDTVAPDTILPETVQPEETTPPEPETTPSQTYETEPGTNPPETEVPEETIEPETETPEETIEPETEAPEETIEPETEEPEEVIEPETEEPEEVIEPETKNPEEPIAPETSDKEETYKHEETSNPEPSERRQSRETSNKKTERKRKRKQKI